MVAYLALTMTEGGGRMKSGNACEVWSVWWCCRSEEWGIILCIAPIFVPFDEASTNWWCINLLVSYCSCALAAPRFRPSWGVLGYIYTKEDLSTIAPVLWLQLLFVPLEVPLALFCSKDLSAIAPVFWWQLLFIPLEVPLAWKICQQIAPIRCYLFIMLHKITTSFTFTLLSRHLFPPFWVFPTLDLFQNCWTIYFIW